VKFTQSGKIILRCKVSGEKMGFEVEDTGIGIHPELQNAVFERFRQVETSYIKNYGGTGLGLSITKAYVEKMGGKIRISSELGKGSVFSFMLPYKPAIREEKKDVTAKQSEPLKEDLTVLVVEDEDINWYYLYEILKGTVKTLRAESGKLALEYINRHPEIDLVLMDIKLPDINGLDLTRMIKAINSKVIIIAQTAFALTGDREKAIDAGCSDYITKPVNKDELLRLIAVHSSK
jgi:CheY-like chemotaxis protein